jgi:malate/lactate dehydrogenase
LLVLFFVEGEYEQNDICIGVPCIIGKNGVEEIIEIELNDMKKACLLCRCSSSNERCAEIDFSLIISLYKEDCTLQSLRLINK